jgi:tRNA (guanine37-N1)-methyltransferase
MIHIHTFSTKSEDNRAVAEGICAEIGSLLGCVISPDDEETEVWDVRDVAPLKRMFCVSFRLPEDVAFRDVHGGA